MEKERNIIYCSRCGAEMDRNSRYCMKCGNLNYDHDSNESMRPFIDGKGSKTYQVGAGQLVSQDVDETLHISIGNNTGNRRFCFFLTSLFYILCFILSCFLFFQNPTSYFIIQTVVISFIFLYIYAVELLFMKCNKPWWASLVPIYNFMVLSDVVFNKSWLGLLFLIPLVGPIILLVLLYRLGKSFRCNGILTVLLPIPYILLMGYGNRFYEDCVFVPVNDDNKFLEREYKYKKIFLILLFSCMLFFFAMVAIFKFDEIRSKVGSFSSYYYVSSAKKIVSKTEKAIVDNNFRCDQDLSLSSSAYYFSYRDLGDYIHLPFYYFRETISGYVRVVFENGEYRYYVSVGDSKKGIPEMEISSITTESVVEMNFSFVNNNSVLSCEIN